VVARGRGLKPRRRSIDHPSSAVHQPPAAADAHRDMPGVRQQLSDERGSMLLEVIVSGALLAVMVIAVYTSFDIASRTSGGSKARAISASLAEADQERLRALPVATLSEIANAGAQTQPPKSIDGIEYTVTSKADWVADASQGTSCASNGAAADYVKIVSTVSAPATAGIRPVTLTSVVTPPAGTFGAGQGSLAVSVVDAAGAPLRGIAATLSGTGVGATRTTDDAGCAFFGYQPTGSFTAGVAASNHVDPSGNPTPTEAVNIAADAVSTQAFRYDVADSVAVTFDTTRVNATTGVLEAATTAASARRVRFVHGAVATPRTFGDGTPATSITADKLFPFPADPYSVYAGDCDGARPASPPSVLATPTGPPGVLVRVPTLVFAVRSGGANVLAPVVKLTATGTGCSGTTQLSKGPVAGRVWDALPFGAYSYCATNGTRKVTGTVTNDDPAGKTVTVPDLAGAPAVDGTCP
jgi:Tfp pilus assembly protein PilE